MSAASCGFSLNAFAPAAGSIATDTASRRANIVRTRAISGTRYIRAVARPSSSDDIARNFAGKPPDTPPDRPLLTSAYSSLVKERAEPDQVDFCLAPRATAQMRFLRGRRLSEADCRRTWVSSPGRFHPRIAVVSGYQTRIGQNAATTTAGRISIAGSNADLTRFDPEQAFKSVVNAPGSVGVEISVLLIKRESLARLSFGCRLCLMLGSERDHQSLTGRRGAIV
jgi:hypothetical protein